MTEFEDSLDTKERKIRSQKKVKGIETAQQLGAPASLSEDLGLDFPAPVCVKV